MRKRLLRWQLAGLLFTLAAGAALHFAFDFLGGNRLAAAFVPVNESVWEHGKLLFFPLLLFAAGSAPAGLRRYENFLAAKGVSIFVGTLLIPLLYYSYSGAWGKHALPADIAVFVLAALAAFLLDSWLLAGRRLSAGFLQALGLLLLLLLLFAFFRWSFHPPHIALFEDPATGLYGIPVK